MLCSIETSSETGGRWVARVAAVPGLAAFGGTEEEALKAAIDMARILLPAGDRNGSIILGFYPGRIPDHARAEALALAR